MLSLLITIRTLGQVVQQVVQNDCQLWAVLMISNNKHRQTSTTCLPWRMELDRAGRRYPGPGPRRGRRTCWRRCWAARCYSCRWPPPSWQLLTTAELPPPASCLLAPAPRKAGRDPDTTAARGQCQEVAAALLSANYAQPSPAQPSIAMQRHKLSSHWVWHDSDRHSTAHCIVTASSRV